MRLDLYLVKYGYFDSRNKAKEAIERGEIFIFGQKELKVAKDIIDGTSIEVRQSKKFVSLGGYKLDKALTDFNYSVQDKICADIGASTGGFTDCLLQNGARTVFSVDLNDDLLHISLKNNTQVIPVIKNAKELRKSDFNKKIDLITADLSFISATSVLGVLSKLIENGKDIILLIKPQFETGERVKFKNGIVRDKKYRIMACKNIYDCALKHSLVPRNITRAPNAEDKNIEFLLLLTKSGGEPLAWNVVEKLC